MRRYVIENSSSMIELHHYQVHRHSIGLVQVIDGAIATGFVVLYRQMAWTEIARFLRICKVLVGPHVT